MNTIYSLIPTHHLLLPVKRGILFIFFLGLASTGWTQTTHTLQDADVSINENGIITSCSYNFSDNTGGTDLTIPETLDGKTVFGIYDGGVFRNKIINKLALPTTLTTIGSYAFYENNIQTLTLPASLTTIGESAFRKNQLIEVTFNVEPNKSQIKSIGSNAFSDNTGTDTGLTSITLPEHAEGTDVRYEDIGDENNLNQEYSPGETFSSFERSLITMFPDYTLQKGDVIVSHRGIITKCNCKNFASNSIIIPEKIDGETITGIGNSAFQEKNLVAVAFADGSQITSIESYAFFNNQIATLTLPTSLTTIKEGAFQHNQIATLTLPTTLTTIEKSAFKDNQITTLTLPTTLTVIGESVFQGNRLTTLTLPTTLTSIGKNAFQGNRLTTLDLPASLTTIKESAFSHNLIGGLILPTILTSIGKSAFAYNSLTTVTFNVVDQKKSQIKNIGKDAFSENTKLTGITLPEHARKTDEHNVTYKDSDGKEYLPGEIFSNFDSRLVAVLSYYTLKEGDVTVVDGIITECTCNFFSNRIIIPEKIDGETITGIADKTLLNDVFQDKSLVAVAFAAESKITSIGNYAFGNNFLDKIVLPPSLMTIGTNAFYNNNLSSVSFAGDKSQLVSISTGAFDMNEALEHITLPAHADEDFDKYVDDAGNKYDANTTFQDFGRNLYANLPYTLTHSDITLVEGVITECKCENLPSSIIIPAIVTTSNGEELTITGIGNSAFINKNLRFVSFLGDSKVTFIDTYAFRRNILLVLTLPSSLTTIGERAFQYNKLKVVTFDEGSLIEKIERGAFSKNEALSPITLPQQHGNDNLQDYRDSKGTVVTEITDFSLSYAAFIPHELTYADITLNQGVITYCKCENLSSAIIIPAKVSHPNGEELSITGIESEVFRFKELLFVQFSEGLSSIGGYAFSSNKLTTLTIPRSVIYIGNFAFYNNDLTSVTLSGDDTNKSQLQAIGTNAFHSNSANLESITLPPNANFDAYQDSEGDNYIPGNYDFTEFSRKVFAAVIVSYELTADDITLNSEGVIIACNCDNFQSRDITIPESVVVGMETKNITGIGKDVFKEKGLNSVTFVTNSKVTHFGRAAFFGNNLSDISFPESLKNIGDYAFANNTLTTVTFASDVNTGPGIQHIGSSAFVNNDFDEMTLPVQNRNNLRYYKASNGNQVNEITDFSLSFSAYIPYTLTHADITLVDGVITACECENLPSSIIIPATVTTSNGEELAITRIDSQAFGIVSQDFQSKALTFLEITEGLTSIANYAFSNNLFIEITIPRSVKYIGDLAFFNNDLYSVILSGGATIKSQIKSIGSGAFSGNTGLTSITLPEHAEGTDVTYKDSDNQEYNPTDEDNNSFTHFNRSLVTVLAYYTLTEGDVTVDDQGIITECLRCEEFVSNRITIPVQIGTDIITGIGNEAFRNKNLAAVIFADESKVISIGESAFDNNIIEALVLPATLKTIKQYAFYRNKITEVVFDDDPEKSQIRNIEKDAFSENTGLTSITLPEHADGTDEHNVIYKDDIDDYSSGDSFSNFDSRLVAVLSYYTLKEGDVTVDDQGIITECLRCEEFVSNSITIPVQIGTQTITGVGDRAFENKGIVALSFSDDSEVTSIGVEAFRQNFLISVQLPPSLVSIKERAFVDNLNLPFFTTPLVAKEGFRTYWKDSYVPHRGTNPTIHKAEFVKSFELVSIQQFTLTTLVEGQQGGVITRSKAPDDIVTDIYDIDTKVTLRAIPTSGWRFFMWVIDEDTVITSKINFTLNANKTVTAHFVELATLTLIIEETLGKVNGLNAGTNRIYKGADFELKATPESGQRFASWTIGGQIIVDNPYTLPATDTKTDISITVTFEDIPQQVTLTLYIEGKGRIDPSIEPNSVETYNVMKGMYDINTVVKLTANSYRRWRFDKWVIGGEDINDKTTTITLDKSKSVTAHFVEEEKEEEEEEAITSILTEVVSATPYPNPAISHLTILSREGDRIQLFSPAGISVYEALHQGTDPHWIDVSDLPSETYLFRLTDSQGNTFTKRIVKN